MIFSYIAAIVAMLLIIGVASIAVISVAKSVSRNIRSKTLKLVSTYDDVLENYTQELEKMKVEMKQQAQQKPVVVQQSVQRPVRRTPEPARNFAPSVLSAVEKVVNTKYVGENSFEIYKTLKDGFRISIDDVVAKIPDFNAPAGMATSLLRELDSQTVLSLMTLAKEVQYQLIRESIDDVQIQFLDAFCTDPSIFDTMEFCMFLRSKASQESQKPVVHISPGYDIENLPDDVKVVVDESLAEGFTIFVNNTVYDYSVRSKVVG